MLKRMSKAKALFELIIIENLSPAQVKFYAA